MLLIHIAKLTRYMFLLFVDMMVDVPYEPT